MLIMNNPIVPFHFLNRHAKKSPWRKYRWVASITWTFGQVYSRVYYFITIIVSKYLKNYNRSIKIFVAMNSKRNHINKMKGIQSGFTQNFDTNRIEWNRSLRQFCYISVFSMPLIILSIWRVPNIPLNIYIRPLIILKMWIIDGKFYTPVFIEKISKI